MTSLAARFEERGGTGLDVEDESEASDEPITAFADDGQMKAGKNFTIRT